MNKRVAAVGAVLIVLAALFLGAGHCVRSVRARNAFDTAIAASMGATPANSDRDQLPFGNLRYFLGAFFRAFCSCL